MSKKDETARSDQEPVAPGKPKFKHGDLMHCGATRCIIQGVLAGVENRHPAVRYFVVPADRPVVFPLAKGGWVTESQIGPLSGIAVGAPPDTPRG